MRFEQALPYLRTGHVISCSDDEFWLTPIHKGTVVSDFEIHVPAHGNDDGLWEDGLWTNAILRDTWQVFTKDGVKVA